MRCKSVRDRPSIRKAVSEDSAAVLGVLRAAFAPYRSAYTTAAYRETVLTAESFEKRRQQMTVFVALGGEGKIVGTVSYEANDSIGHIRGMAVHPRWHGARVAHALLAQVETELQGLQCVAVTLETTRPLVRAIRFYERNGYAATGRSRQWQGMELLQYKKSILLGTSQSGHGGTEVP